MHKIIQEQNLKVKSHSQDLDENGRVILRKILQKGSEVAKTAFVWLRYCPVADSCVNIIENPIP
jgi:hypothetical protein